MSEMIEVVAEALYLSAPKTQTSAGLFRPRTHRWKELPEVAQNAKRRQARAAIEAMRVPSDAMLRRMGDITTAQWPAVITAALGTAQGSVA